MRYISPGPNKYCYWWFGWGSIFYLCRLFNFFLKKKLLKTYNPVVVKQTRIMYIFIYTYSPPSSGGWVWTVSQRNPGLSPAWKWTKSTAQVATMSSNHLSNFFCCCHINKTLHRPLVEEQITTLHGAAFGLSATRLEFLLFRAPGCETDQ